MSGGQAEAFLSARRERARLSAEYQQVLRRQEAERRAAAERLRALDEELKPLADALQVQVSALSDLGATALAGWEISRSSMWPSGQLHLASRRSDRAPDWISRAVWLRVVLPGGLGVKAPTWVADVGSHGLGFQVHELGPAEGDPEEEWGRRSQEAERLAEEAGFWLLRGIEWRDPTALEGVVADPVGEP